MLTDERQVGLRRRRVLCRRDRCDLSDRSDDMGMPLDVTRRVVRCHAADVAAVRCTRRPSPRRGHAVDHRGRVPPLSVLRSPAVAHALRRRACAVHPGGHHATQRPRSVLGARERADLGRRCWGRRGVIKGRARAAGRAVSVGGVVPGRDLLPPRPQVSLEVGGVVGTLAGETLGDVVGVVAGVEDGIFVVGGESVRP